MRQKNRQMSWKTYGGYTAAEQNKGKKGKQIRTDKETHGTLKAMFTFISLVAQVVKNLPAMKETLVQFLGQVDLVEKG